MEFSTEGTYLAVKASTETKYKKAYGLYETPEMGGNKEKIDVTNLSDSHKRNIDGIADYGDALNFSFYDNTGDEDTADMIMQTYSTFRAWELAKTKVDFRLVYPDGTGFEWSGTVSTSRDAATVNAPVGFKMYATLSSELKDYTEASASSFSFSE